MLDRARYVYQIESSSAQSSVRMERAVVKLENTAHDSERARRIQPRPLAEQSLNNGYFIKNQKLSTRF
jgi:hypothetical protein